jgi:hypothetical protein
MSTLATPPSISAGDGEYLDLKCEGLTCELVVDVDLGNTTVDLSDDPPLWHEHFVTDLDVSLARSDLDLDDLGGVPQAVAVDSLDPYRVHIANPLALDGSIEPNEDAPFTDGEGEGDPLLPRGIDGRAVIKREHVVHLNDVPIFDHESGNIV